MLGYNNTQETGRATLEDELLLDGDALPLESIRSCELAVECWNLRNSLAEADQSYNYTKKDIKMENHAHRRVQAEMTEMQKALKARDNIDRNQCAEIKLLKLKLERSEASRNCVINHFSKTEHLHKDISLKYNHLEAKNQMIQTEIATLKKYWEEKYSSMEMSLTLDAQQADAERDMLKVSYRQKEKQYREADIDRNHYKQQLLDLRIKCKSLEERNLILEDKCVWGFELEQAYESLHKKLEISSAEKALAHKRIIELKKEKIKILSFAQSEGMLLPSYISNDY